MVLNHVEIAVKHLEIVLVVEREEAVHVGEQRRVHLTQASGMGKGRGGFTAGDQQIPPTAPGEVSAGGNRGFFGE